MNYDDVMNKQRQLIYAQRIEVVDGKDVLTRYLNSRDSCRTRIVNEFVDLTSTMITASTMKKINNELELKVH
jgi:preprotein translocase subunit SecA